MAIFAWFSLIVASASALFIAADEMRRPQRMAIMNVVWPVSALYFSLLAVWGYLQWGEREIRGPKVTEEERSSSRQASVPDHQQPTLAQVAIGTSHCGAGCVIADVLCAFLIATTGITLLGSALFTEYVLEFAAAWALGIVFQYFSIKPMGSLSVSQAIVAAIKADTLSIAAFQVGMYAWMAVVNLVLFPHPRLTAFDARYWLMMQIGMICGFASSFPMNRWLLRNGLKKAM